MFGSLDVYLRYYSRIIQLFISLTLTLTINYRLDTFWTWTLSGQTKLLPKNIQLNIKLQNKSISKLVA